MVKKVSIDGETMWSFAKVENLLTGRQENQSMVDVDSKLSVSETPPVNIPAQQIEELSLKNTLKNRKKKARRKNKSPCTTTSALSDEEMKLHVLWGSVEEILFARQFSDSAVPSRGLFPLGLGRESGRETMSIDQYIERRRIELSSRAVSLGLFHDVDLSSSWKDNTSTYLPLETRSYDYKVGQNPLFHATDELERVQLLGAAARENLQNPISKLNHEISQIHTSRDNCGGCSCKQLKVDKLSLTKLKSELFSRADLFGGLSKEDIEGLSKSEIVSKCKEINKLCQLCVDNKCECISLGISCNVMQCGCLHKGTKIGQNVACGNIDVTQIFDEETVHAYRVNVIARECGTSNQKPIPANPIATSCSKSKDPSSPLSSNSAKSPPLTSQNSKKKDRIPSSGQPQARCVATGKG